MDNQQLRLFDDKILVSNCGKVFRCLNGWHKLIDSDYIIYNNSFFQEANIHLSPKGYANIKHKNTTYQVHRLVALCFISNPDNKEQVNHIDGDKLNNNYLNLEWVTNRENLDHALNMGLRKKIDEELATMLLTQTSLTQTQICDKLGCGSWWLKNFIKTNEILRPKNYVKVKITIDRELALELLTTTYLSYREIGDILGCTKDWIVKFVKNNKVQRPNDYDRYLQRSLSRSKLVGSKWNRNGEIDESL